MGFVNSVLVTASNIPTNNSFLVITDNVSIIETNPNDITNSVVYVQNDADSGVQQIICDPTPILIAASGKLISLTEAITNTIFYINPDFFSYVRNIDTGGSSIRVRLKGTGWLKKDAVQVIENVTYIQNAIAALAPPIDTDEKVKIDAADNTAGYLDGKLVAGTNISFVVSGPGNKTLTINSSGGGITTLNTLTGAVQTFAVGTSGNDFGISSSGTTHTFNIPTASASNRGLLSTTDWTTFNNKLDGSGTTNRITMFTSSSTVGDGTWSFSTNDIVPVTAGSNIGSVSNYVGTVYLGSTLQYASDLIFSEAGTERARFNGGNFAINTSSPSAKLHIVGDSTSTGEVLRMENSSNIRTFLFQDDATFTIGSSGASAGFITIRATNNTSDLFSAFNGAGSNVFKIDQANGIVEFPSYSTKSIGYRGSNTFGFFVDSTTGANHLMSATDNAQFLIRKIGSATYATAQLEVVPFTTNDCAIFYRSDATTEILKLKEVGTIAMASLQVGNAGLSSFDLYKDTAANILANGDYVIGMKL